MAQLGSVLVDGSMIESTLASQGMSIRFFHRAPRPTLIIRDTGFDIQSGETRWSVEWNQICAITAFKRDELTTDSLTIEFLVENGTRYEVSEDVQGYSELERVLGVYFPLPHDWRRDVLLPAFRENRTVIYRRAN